MLMQDFAYMTATCCLHRQPHGCAVSVVLFFVSYVTFGDSCIGGHIRPTSIVVAVLVVWFSKPAGTTTATT